MEDVTNKKKSIYSALLVTLFLLFLFIYIEKQIKMTGMNSVSKYLSKKVYQYELQTALYMLEPWEKILFSKKSMRFKKGILELKKKLYILHS